MKRQLLIAALLATPLYLRQREVEKRQRVWRRATEAELRLHLNAIAAERQRLLDQLLKVRREEAKATERFVKSVHRELSRAGGR